MAKPLTAISVEKARAHAERRELADGGCTGLYLIVQPSGVKSWAARYRYRGRSIKLTLGPVLIGARAEAASTPEVGAPLSLASARELCARVLREAQAGRDPAAEKRQRREREHAAGAETLWSVCQEHLRRNSYLRSIDQRRADFELFYPSLGQQPIEEIKRGQFVRVLDQIADERGQRRASRALGSMKTLLNWHGNRSEYVSKLTRTGWRTSAPEGGRDRVLDDTEIRKIVLAAEADHGPFAAFIRFVLLTATRRNEAARLRRSELSADGATWTIPAARYKQKRDVVIPLSAKAQQIIASQPHLPGGDYVFSHSGARAINDFADAKTRFDKALRRYRLAAARSETNGAYVVVACGIRPDIAELCLGHRIGGIRGIYDRFEFIDEKARRVRGAGRADRAHCSSGRYRGADHPRQAGAAQVKKPQKPKPGPTQILRPEKVEDADQIPEAKVSTTYSIQPSWVIDPDAVNMQRELDRKAGTNAQHAKAQFTEKDLAAFAEYRSNHAGAKSKTIAEWIHRGDPDKTIAEWMQRDPETRIIHRKKGKPTLKDGKPQLLSVSTLRRKIAQIKVAEA